MKDNSKSKWLIIAFCFTLLIALVGLFIRENFTQPTIQAQVSSFSTFTNEPVLFTDSTQAATSWKWEFGDNDSSLNKVAYHDFKSPGQYLVKLTINKKFNRTFLIKVRDRLIINAKDSIPIIEGPTSGFQGEYLILTCKSEAKWWRWNFGEKNGIDSRDQTVIYQYKQPGNYTIKVETENSKYPALFNIKILPAFSQMDSLDVEGLLGKVNNDIKDKLQNIANGKDFNTNYYYIINKYLCKNEHIAVSVNNQKLNDFYSYCMGLRLEKKATIEAVATEQQTIDETDCITKINVIQQ